MGINLRYLNIIDMSKFNKKFLKFNQENIQVDRGLYNIALKRIMKFCINIILYFFFK